VILLWQMYMGSKHPPRIPDAGPADTGLAAHAGLDGEKTGKKEEDQNLTQDESPEQQEQQEDARYEEETFKLSNNFFEAVFTNKGGRLKSFELKRYYLARIPHKRVNLVPDNDSTLAVVLQNRIYKFSGSERYVFSEVSEKRVVLEHTSLSGVVIRKEFSVSGNYEITLNVRVINNTDKDFIFKPSLLLSDSALKGGLTKEDLNSSLEEYYHPLCLANDALFDGRDLKKGSISKSMEGKINWLSSASRYFISAVIPIDQKITMCRFASDENYNFLAELVYPEMKAETKKETLFSYRLYLGPKGYSMLKKIGSGLDRAVDFGWLAVLCIPLLYLLSLFYSFVHNYGIAIILLTIIIKLISIPFTQKSMKSMQELQKLKPKLDELQKKYKDNREKLNEEMMRLYREHGVSPFGGCLPMLLQMPIWFALYRMLSNSVELYQAVFIPGWINDLSSKDPYYILPVLLGAGTFLQQKMTPTTMDSTQAKVMLYFMPAFLTFIMISLPSGLTLYIFVSSVLSIVHQVYMNRTNQINQIQSKNTREEEK
ncbi:MAG: membrane protein insertase YidC, partial [Deltaproteobacteria bacterium]|nr:membrane protein insertase YidC [Deltaproteobacteria bacterium]